MNEKEKPRPKLRIPIITTDGEAQTSGQLVLLMPEKEKEKDTIKTKENNKLNMEATDAQQNLRKRRNLSKNRGQATRQREKTPEPGRMGSPHEDTPSSDEGDAKKDFRTSREIEAEDNYKEMMRLVQERAEGKDPDDLDQDEIIKARHFAENERRRRSISPFAVPDKEEIAKLQRKGSFVDPSNKLLSTAYTLSPKEEDSERRNSLTSDSPIVRKGSPSPSTPTTGTSSAAFPFPTPPSPRKQSEMVYSDEIEKKKEHGRTVITPVKKDIDVFTFDETEIKPKPKPVVTQKQEQIGGLVTKVITVERSPSRKLAPENKPVVETRPSATVERTPSRKSLSESKPIVVQRASAKQSKESGTQDPQSRRPPVKPVRSKSASRFGGKTSESEMSEDQMRVMRENAPIPAKRKAVPTPRRFIRNKSPTRVQRSQSATRVEDSIDKKGTEISRTSREIIQLLEQARARSLSIPKDETRIPSAYRERDKRRTLATPNKSPASRQSRGISCPKTIQLISSTEVLAGLTKVQKLDLEFEKRRKSKYIDASQSEYTSSCYSSSASENDFDFNLENKSAELNRKLSLLSLELETPENILQNNKEEFSDKFLRKRSTVNNRNVVKKELPKQAKPNIKKNSERKQSKEIVKMEQLKQKDVTPPSKYRILNIIREWHIFKTEQTKQYTIIKYLFNRCISDLIILIIYCGIGGIIFKNLEGSFESNFKCGSRNVKRDFIENLWKGTHYMREEDWKAMARNKLHEFEDQLHAAHEAGVTSHSSQRSWNFMNSFVYCLTIVTTIGYGHIVPSTFYGQIATIFYAIIGIPLFLIVLADFGKLFTRIIKFFWAFIRRLYYTGSCRKVRKTAPMQEMMRGFNMVYDVVRRPSQMVFEEDVNAIRRPSTDQLEDPERPAPNRPDDAPPPLPPKPGQQPTWVLGSTDLANGTPPDTPAPSNFEIDDEFNLPISVAIVILILYILVGAVVYMSWEEWTFFQSFYFVFVSMSTIGFGDLVPGHPMYMMASILYLVFGLALTSMCINVVQVKLSDTFKQASAKLGATIGFRVTEDDGALVPITPAADLAQVHRPKPKESSDAKEVEFDAEISNAMKSE